jgi:adenylate cyclase
VFDDERFCAQCGSPIGGAAPAQPAAPPGAERKQVTVLFADVVSSMELAERLDADELTEVMQGLFTVCRDAVEAFGGTVDKFTGDGVMALFGAPVSLEDHARRACHAALRLIDGATIYAEKLRVRDVDLAVRVGLNSGEVVAGSVGGDAVGGGYTAVGHTVGLAQRMESAAQPGTVRLSEHTASLAGGDFRLRDLGLTEVRGSSVPLRVFALDGASGGSSAAGRRRVGSARMVGRDEEFAALRSALTAAVEGRAQVVGLVGEAGAGKSRLCEELAGAAAELGITVRRTAGVSHATTVPLLPILGLLRDYFSVVDTDSAVEVQVKVAGTLLALDGEFAADLPLVYDFLEVPDPAQPVPAMSPETRQRRILDVLRRATSKRSERSVLLLVLEDLHWFDPRSVAFLNSWLPSFPGTRTLIVTNFRPEFQAPWSRHSYYRQIPLAPLDAMAVHRLLDELLGPDPSLILLTRGLWARTGGNPFFVEEIVRGLAADGTLDGLPGAYRLTRPTTDVRVPPTVLAVLAERIDRLTARDKATLQAAAVIGRTFTRAVLGPVAGLDGHNLDEALQALCFQELLQETGSDGEYRFWHPLTQEVAYGSLLAAPRRRLHQAVAGGLIALGTERHDELAAMVATHFEAAEDRLEAGRWQLRAGARATRGDFAEARRRLRASIDHLAAVGDDVADALVLGVSARTVLLRFGVSTGMDPVEADELSAEARASAQRIGDLGLLARVSMADGVARYYRGDPAGGLASLLEARDQADEAGEHDLWVFCWLLTGLASIFVGPLDGGLQAVEKVLDLCADHPLAGAAAAGYSCVDFAHMVQALLRVPAGALDDARRSAELAGLGYERRPMAAWHAWTMSAFTHLADYTGEPADVERARDAAGQAARLAGDSGNIGAALVIALQSAGIAALLDDRPTEAAATFTEALAEARQRRTGLMYEAGLLAYLARARLAMADGAAAREAADEAVAVAHRQGAKVMECQAQVVRARVFRVTATCDADRTEARNAVAASEVLAVETGAATHAAFLAEERARLDGDPGALGAAAAGYEAIGAIGHARRLYAELTVN